MRASGKMKKGQNFVVIGQAKMKRQLKRASCKQILSEEAIQSNKKSPLRSVIRYFTCPPLNAFNHKIYKRKSHKGLDVQTPGPDTNWASRGIY